MIPSLTIVYYASFGVRFLPWTAKEPDQGVLEYTWILALVSILLIILIGVIAYFMDSYTHGSSYMIFFPPPIIGCYLFQFLIYLRLTGTIQLEFYYILGPIWLLGLVALLFFAFQSIALLFLVLTCKFDSNFERFLAEWAVYALGASSFFVISFLEDFYEKGSRRWVYIAFAGGLIVGSLVLVVKGVRKKKFFAFTKNIKVKKRSPKRRNSDKNEKDDKNPALKSLLSFVQVGETLFDKLEKNDKNARELEELNRQTGNLGRQICVICFNAEPNTIYQPCRHGGICQNCAKEIFEKRKECPLCRKKTSHIILYKKAGFGGKLLRVGQIGGEK